MKKLINFSIENRVLFSKLKKDIFNNFNILILFKFNSNFLKNDFQDLKQIKKTKIKFFFPFYKDIFKNFKFYIKYNVTLLELIQYSQLYKKNIVFYTFNSTVIKFDSLIFKYNLINENLVNFSLMDIRRNYYIFLLIKNLFV